jgi:peptide/nickel transport system permease protein
VRSFFGYFLRRLIAALITLILVFTAVFVIFFVLPQAPGSRRDEAHTSPIVVLLAGKRIQDRAYVDRLTEELQLGVPLGEQYLRFLGNALRADFGYGYTFNVPVSGMLKASLPASASLMVGALVLWLPLAIIGGSYAARRRRSHGGRVLNAIAYFSMATPVFVTAIAVLYLIRLKDPFSVLTYSAPGEGFVAHAKAMWMPWTVLAFTFFGRYLRFLRSRMLEIENEDYMRTAEAKGLSETAVARHQLRASLTPIASLLSVDAGVLFGALVFVEPIFEVPGLGSLLYGAMTGLNFPVLVGVTLVGSLIVVAASFLVDLAYGWIDPQVRLS